jgi:hypothetical protein
MRNCIDTKSYPIYSYPSVPLPAGGGAYCLGSNINLACGFVPGASYYWTGPNGFTSTSQNPTITNASNAVAGSYDVVVINGTCTSAVASIIISIVQQPVASSNSPVCFGQTANFTSSFIAGANYAWTGPNGFTSSLQNPTRTGVTPSDTGLYTLNVTLAGCSLNSTFTRLSGLQVPIAPTVGNSITICTGENINLTASGNYLNPTYNWSGPNNFTSNSQNPSFISTGINNSGTYSVSVTVNGCSSNSSIISAVVKAIPNSPTVASNGALCIGQTLSLSASAIANASYTWSGPNNFTSNFQNPSRSSVTAADGGLYSVYATVNGCSSNAASTTVVVSTTAPSPSASSNSPVCTGQTLSLSASNIAGATYSWTGPNGFTSNAQNPVINNVTAAGAGTYSVTAATATCGTSPASNVNVVINALTVTPVASNAGPVCEGSATSLRLLP